MQAILQQCRIALRQTLKTPVFSLTVVLTLALGIGSTTAIFSLVEGVLLRPLPFRDPGRLVLVGDHVGNATRTSVTAREISTYANAATAFSSMGAYIATGYELSSDATPQQVSAARLTTGVFSTLGVQPVVGRVFTEQEDVAHQPVVVISYALWMNRYHRDPHVIGTSIELDRKTYSIVGVMPRNFEFPLQTGHLNQGQLWVPLSLTNDELSEIEAGRWGFHIVARLNDGVSLDQAARDADRVAQQVMRNFPATMTAIRIRGDAGWLREDAVSDARPLLRTMFVAVSIVLLIACVNVAGLLLVRAIRRRREYAVRLALGAQSSVIVRESVAEGLLLSLAGGLLGLGLAAMGVRLALRLLPESMPRIDSIAVDAPVAIFALVLALVTGAVCSLAPAFAALKTNLIDSLKEGARTGTGDASHAWLRSALVVAEIAVALVLLTLSGAFLRSYQKMLAVDPGYLPDHALVAVYHLPIEQYPTQSSAERFNQRVEEALAQKPGVVAIGIANSLPASGAWGESAYTIEEEPIERWKLKFAEFSITDGDYFRAVGIRLLDGRYFTPNDRADTPLVVIVNESMAKHSWPGQRAVGKRMHAGNPRKGLPWATVVGVVADTRLGSRDTPSGDEWYSPLQQPVILSGAGTDTLTSPAGGYIAIRSVLPPEDATRTLLSTIAAIDPHLALEEVRPMTDVLSKVEAPRRFNTSLISVFALGALLLAVIGIYAVVAFSVSMRTHEIAIRMALGAQRTGIARLVLYSSLKLALLGCGIGVVCSLAVSRLVSAFLFGVSANDPLIYSASVVVMMLVTLMASAIPATRAASCDPAGALRSI
jgi:putative ABC transport system permease protein